MSPLLGLAILGLCPLVFGAPEVDISQGRIRGHTLLSRNGREYAAFTGIPYAKPPVADLRLMPPEPAPAWTGVFNATKVRPICFQESFLRYQHGLQGQEDCLYITVQTPKIDASYPVMVYVHGGGFNFGWPGSAMKARYFMDEDVVLVTFSYRLGYLGFLSLEDDVLPGNYGLKDQILALEWVKREIKNFGGNPDKITAFGISAGGASTHYLCSSPKAKALLKGCISQSGIGGSIWSLHVPGDARQTAIDFAQRNGCDMQNSSKVLSCLQTLPTEVFIRSIDVLHLSNFPGPVIENISETAVITQWPSTHSDFPWIAGVMANEGQLFTEYIKDFATTSQKLAFYLGGNIVLAKALRLPHAFRATYQITRRFFHLRDFFCLLSGYEKFFTELFWLYPSFMAMDRHAGPKYFYKFSYTGGPTLWEQASNKSLNMDGACHGNDAPYFFDLSNYFEPQGWPSPKDIKLSQNLIKMWVNFAKHQVPGTDVLQWDQFGKDANYLEITNSGLNMKKYSDYKDIIDFWNEIHLPVH